MIMHEITELLIDLRNEYDHTRFYRFFYKARLIFIKNRLLKSVNELDINNMDLDFLMGFSYFYSKTRKYVKTNFKDAFKSIRVIDQTRLVVRLNSKEYIELFFFPEKKIAKLTYNFNMSDNEERYATSSVMISDNKEIPTEPAKYALEILKTHIYEYILYTIDHIYDLKEDEL